MGGRGRNGMEEGKGTPRAPWNSAQVNMESEEYVRTLNRSSRDRRRTSKYTAQAHAPRDKERGREISDDATTRALAHKKRRTYTVSHRR